MKTKEKRALSLVFAIAFVFSVLIFSFYIEAEITHDCIGEDCPVCQHIHICERVLESISLGIPFVMNAYFMYYISNAGLFASVNIMPVSTLVSLKVKLSN